MRVDLHCHSSASDGELSPEALLLEAVAADIQVLAITDHDTIAGFEQARRSSPSSLHLVPGVEFSARWTNTSVHVVGLNFDPHNPLLTAALARQFDARQQRAEIIAQRLEKKGLGALLPAVRELAGNACVGRPHFAQHLFNNGQVKSIEEAFRKYLGSGKAGDVKVTWPELDTVVGWIRAAGGDAVLAHPYKYRLTRSRLYRLARDFKSAGGNGVEVVSGKQDPSQSAALARLCEEFKLLASAGSDFHRPGQPWAALGGYSPLPGNCRPVWERWRL